MRAGEAGVGDQEIIRYTLRAGNGGACVVIGSAGRAAVDQSSAGLALSSAGLPVVSNRAGVASVVEGVAGNAVLNEQTASDASIALKVGIGCALRASDG